jgi:hypothetical protein
MEINSQYIDSNGKTRFINVEGNTVTLVFSIPLAPLNVSETRQHILCSVSVLESFKEKFDLVLTKTVPNVGVWVKYKNQDCFIPLETDFSLTEDLPTETNYPLVLYTNSKTIFKTYRERKRIAEILKDSVIKLYIEFKDEYKSKIVVGKPKYIETNSLSFFNSNGDLIVQSQKIKDSLITITESKILNSKTEIKNSISRQNFKIRPTELIFTSQDLVLKWLDENKTRFEIFNSLDFSKKEPFAYKNIKINKDFFLVQNVQKNSKELAITESYIWLKEKRNVGFFFVDVLENIDSIEYIEFDINGNILEGTENEILKPKIIQEDFKFAAILPLD